jgi:hypothetical protein
MDLEQTRKQTFSCPPFKDGGIKTPAWKAAVLQLAELSDALLHEADTSDDHIEKKVFAEWAGDLTKGVDALNAAIREMLVERNSEIHYYKAAYKECFSYFCEAADLDDNTDPTGIDRIESEELFLMHGEDAKAKLLRDWQREKVRRYGERGEDEPTR